MTIKKLDDGRYEVDIRPNGRNGKRIRRKFDRKYEAQTFEFYIIARSQTKEWQTQRVERRSLSVLREEWWSLYGHALKNADIEKRQLDKTIRAMNDPLASKVNRRFILEFRSQQLDTGLKSSTVNRDLYRMSGMFSKLIEAEAFRGENPFKGLKPLYEDEPEMTFLTSEEITGLLGILTGDARRLALLCISTGARWDEAKSLKSEHIVNGRVTFMKTKNGKKRTIPISAELEKEVKTVTSGALFTLDYKWFSRKLKAFKPNLPRGQATHVLRHTFASHFMMNGGNLIALKDILGHANIQQTMVYAHLAPDFMQHAILLNPLRGTTRAECPQNVHKMRNEDVPD